MRGCTLEEMANDLGVAVSTISKWIKENEELSEAIKRGRGYADTMVERSLFQRAIGMEYTERKVTMVTSKNGEPPEPKVETTTKKIVPDTLACIFWLKNRMPNVWRDKTEVMNKIEAKTETKVDTSNIPNEILEQVMKYVTVDAK